jgi:cellulose synthase/poly-beta-1,6-N-acetylglucosamine synthase-like glycosyltransferase
MSDQISTLYAVALKGDGRKVLEFLAVNIILIAFGYGIFVYLLARLTFFRHLVHSPSAKPKLDLDPSRPAPSIAILVPAYCEEPAVIWQTILSAALLDYPDRRIVLLLDNPPSPSTLPEKELLAQSRALPGRLRDLFQPLAERFSTAVSDLRASRQDWDIGNAAEQTGELYIQAAAFLEVLARRIEAGEFGKCAEHFRRLFVERILLEPAKHHRLAAERLRLPTVTAAQLERALAQLDHLFQFEIESFERKRYWNLSHAPSKAANLNAYIGLIGRHYVVLGGDADERGFLIEHSPDAPTINAPRFHAREAEFIMVLDADSFPVADYARRTVAMLTTPGNERIAVAQTPYTAVLGSNSLLERTAGATTDIYYPVAQGMSLLNAASWVGATAMVRKAALDDIASKDTERGHEITIYIPDTTVIEDAEATIRLAAKGWSVKNLPMRLNYSATPADFGALIIQRRRWANGGLILLPVLFAYLRQAPLTKRTLVEGFMRIYYLTAAPITSICGLAIVVYPFDQSLVSVWIGATIFPFLLLHARDLSRSGYSWTDLPGVFALNLLLLPVVLGGVLKSIQQILFRKKIPFARTPKIADRTAVPPLYILALSGLVFWSGFIFLNDLLNDSRGHALPSLWNVLAFTYGCVTFIGLGAMSVDTLRGIAYRTPQLVKAMSATTGRVLRAGRDYVIEGARLTLSHPASGSASLKLRVPSKEASGASLSGAERSLGGYTVVRSTDVDGDLDVAAKSDAVGVPIDLAPRDGERKMAQAHTAEGLADGPVVKPLLSG